MSMQRELKSHVTWVIQPLSMEREMKSPGNIGHSAPDHKFLESILVQTCSVPNDFVLEFSPSGIKSMNCGNLYVDTLLYSCMLAVWDFDLTSILRV